MRVAGKFPAELTVSAAALERCFHPNFFFPLSHPLPSLLLTTLRLAVAPCSSGLLEHPTAAEAHPTERPPQCCPIDPDAILEQGIPEQPKTSATNLYSRLPLKSIVACRPYDGSVAEETRQQAIDTSGVQEDITAMSTGIYGGCPLLQIILGTFSLHGTVL
jgi:hypothetical protein